MQSTFQQSTKRTGYRFMHPLLCYAFHEQGNKLKTKFQEKTKLWTSAHCLKCSSIVIFGILGASNCLSLCPFTRWTDFVHHVPLLRVLLGSPLKGEGTRAQAQCRTQVWVHFQIARAVPDFVHCCLHGEQWGMLVLKSATISPSEDGQPLSGFCHLCTRPATESQRC